MKAEAFVAGRFTCKSLALTMCNKDISRSTFPYVTFFAVSSSPSYGCKFTYFYPLPGESKLSMLLRLGPCSALLLSMRDPVLPGFIYKENKESVSLGRPLCRHECFQLRPSQSRRSLQEEKNNKPEPARRRRVNSCRKSKTLGGKGGVCFFLVVI